MIFPVSSSLCSLSLNSLWTPRGRSPDQLLVSIPGPVILMAPMTVSVSRLKVRCHLNPLKAICSPYLVTEAWDAFFYPRPRVWCCVWQELGLRASWTNWSSVWMLLTVGVIFWICFLASHLSPEHILFKNKDYRLRYWTRDPGELTVPLFDPGHQRHPQHHWWSRVLTPLGPGHSQWGKRVIFFKTVFQTQPDKTTAMRK